MELIQATQVSLLPQGAPTAAWSNNSIPPYSSFLLLTTPSEPLLDLTPSDASLLLNSTCQNYTSPKPGSLSGLAGIFIPLIYGIVCVVGLVGNTLVIHVIVNYTKNESVTNIYILNLAIADELFMLGLPFLAVQNALLSWPFGSLMCRVVMTVDAINQFTSIFCLTVMSVDRYLAVVHPIRSFWWRRPRDDGNCSIVWPEPAEVWKTSFIVYTCTVGFFCPLLVICLCYLLIVIKVRSVGKRAQATSSRRRKSERKITRMVVVVVAVFVLCWLPFYALNIVNLLVVLPGDFRGLYVFVVVCCRMHEQLRQPHPVRIPVRQLQERLQEGPVRHFASRVKNNDRAGTEAQRPTEEWGGIMLQAQKSEGVINVQKEDCGEKEEEEEINGTDGAMQMSKICKTAQNGNHSGVTEGSRTQVEQRGKSEQEHSGQSAKHGELSGKGFESAEAASSVSSKSRKSRSYPEEFLDKNATLEISYL
ncbi:hypothetical protein L3Q82_019990 [Scortum barcoo]|uniref:Uncharacterized protein n=1 Tax=Scortum barcoo TaxID=214431 RepID=A0ACB8VD30_9TELE|nr:hypothetical protein L3Q82_019990 [Scortum barcoo]